MNRKLVALFLVVITLCAPFVSVYGQGLRTHEHAPPVIDMPAENAYERREVETRGDVPLEDALSQSNISENLESGAVLYEGFSFEMIGLPTQTQTEIILEIPTSEREYSETVRSTCNRITYVYSEELSEIDIDATYKTYSGPETFCMTENGDICILDSGSKRIRVYDAESGNEIRTIELYNVNNPTEMITDGANFYVLDVVTSKIIAIDEAENRTEYKLPKVSESYYRPSTDTYDTFEYDMGPLVVELRINEGVLVVCAAQFGEYRLIDGEFVLSENVYNAVDDGEFFNISYGEYNWEIPSKAIGIEIKGVDNEGNIYLYCCSTLLDEKGMLTGDNTLRVYDKDSRLIKAALVDSEERFILPRHHIALGFDNEFYEMICEEDRVSIVRVIPTEDARIKETELSSMDNSVSNMDTVSTEEVISNCAHTSFEDADTLAEDSNPGTASIPTELKKRRPSELY